MKAIISAIMSFFMLISSFFVPGEFTPNPVDPIADGADVRVVTFNVRCKGTFRKAVSYRSELLIAQLKEIDADSIGMQEVTPKWYKLLKEKLDEYAYVGEKRSNRLFEIGEASPIFYKKDKFELLDSDTFWLSETPDVFGSRSWGSANTRICTYAVLKNKETNQVFVHMNTHLDHISAEARVNQSKVLMEKANEYIGKYPVILTGDFNDFPDSEPYAEITSVFGDSRLLAPVKYDIPTFHKYGEKSELIDFIFVSDVTPLVYHVIDDKINDVYLSDHYGIYIDAKF